MAHHVLLINSWGDQGWGWAQLEALSFVVGRLMLAVNWLSTSAGALAGTGTHAFLRGYLASSWSGSWALRLSFPREREPGRSCIALYKLAFKVLQSHFAAFYCLEVGHLGGPIFKGVETDPVIP